MILQPTRERTRSDHAMFGKGDGPKEADTKHKKRKKKK
jgi:hypothetical protein